MPRLWVPDRTIKRVKPPLGAEVDWSHPLARGLVGYWALTETGGNRWRDLTCTSDATNTTPTYGAWKVGQHGSLFQFTGGQTDYWTIPYKAKLRPTGAMTAAALVVCPSTWTASRYGAFLNAGTDGSLREMNLILGYGAANQVRSILTIAGSRRDYYVTSDLIVANKTSSLVFKRAAGGAVAWWVDAQLVVSSAGHAGTIDNTVSADLNIGRFSTLSADFGLYYTGLWNRDISDGEILQLYAEPFALLTVPKRRTYFIVSGAPQQSQAPRSMHQFRLRRA